MKIETITKIQNQKEAIEYTVSFIRLLKWMSLFSFIAVMLFDPSKESFFHCVLMNLIINISYYLFQSGYIGYYSAIAVSLVIDGICFDLSYNKFQEHSYIFALLSHQLFIQSCKFHYYTQPLVYFIIALRTSAWFFLIGRKTNPVVPEPQDVTNSFVALIISQIFLVWIVEVKSRNAISNRLSLEKQVNYLKSILQEISYAILVIDKNIKIKFKNKAYDDLFCNEGYLTMEKKHMAEIKKFINSNKSQEHIGKLFLKDLKLSCNATKGFAEDEQFIILTFNRIFSSKCENELDIANILQDMSHDLKTPLNFIINEQRDVIENEQLSAGLSISLHKNYNTACVLLFFIQDIIDFSNLNSDLLIVVPTFFDVKGLIEECSTYIRYTFQKNCLFHISSDISKLLYFDMSKLRQIIIGIFYTMYNSCPSGDITLNLENCFRFLRFKFEVHSKMPKFKLIFAAFEAFKFRITKELVSKLTGKNLVVQEVKEENKIIVEMEIRTEWESEPETIRDCLAFQNSIESDLLITDFIDILIVDDMEINCEILRNTVLGLEKNCKCSNIHERTYSVHTTNSGKDAIQLLQVLNKEKRGYRLIFMDCQMPELDGWETSKLISKMFEEKCIYHLPYIIAYTAYDIGNDRSRYKLYGMCDYLPKPCLREELCRVIRYWLSKPIKKLSS